MVTGLVWGAGFVLLGAGLLIYGRRNGYSAKEYWETTFGVMIVFSLLFGPLLILITLLRG